MDIQDKKVDIESVLSEKGRFDSCESDLPLFGTIYFLPGSPVATVHSYEMKHSLICA